MNSIWGDGWAMKRQDIEMISTTIIKISFLSGLCWGITGCASGGNTPPRDTEPPKEIPTDSETVDRDTGDPVEGPPELPDLCELMTKIEGGEPVGQKKLSGKGDANAPDIQFNPTLSSSLTTWAYYDSPNAVLEWMIQTARYTVTAAEVDGGIAIEGVVGDIRNPTPPGAVAHDPSLAAGEDGYGLVWKDGRWDSSCSASDLTGCRRELAFMAIDADGDPTGDTAEPVRLTTGAELKFRPAIAAVPGGYLVTWTEMEGTQPVLFGARLGPTGNIDAMSQLSDEASLYEASNAAVAANDKLAVIAWTTHDRNRIVARIWYHDRSGPSDEVTVISEVGNELLRPKIAAGENGFMALWSVRQEMDTEIYVQPLDAEGEPILEPHRATWTSTDVVWADISGSGSAFAMAWANERKNGEEECVREECSEQIFAALIGEDGAPASAPVMLSNDPNESRRVELAWDGEGWTAVWETMRLNRWQVFYGQMVCH
jgi:hypothetical protein